MELNANQIQEIIPHRPPFLLVDRITDYEPGVWAKGRKAVTVNEPFFAGHFPQRHVMPGVLIIEALAQVGAVAILSLPENRGKIAFFGGIKNARFKRQVVPATCWSSPVSWWSGGEAWGSVRRWPRWTARWRLRAS